MIESLVGQGQEGTLDHIESIRTTLYLWTNTQVTWAKPHKHLLLGCTACRGL